MIQADLLLTNGNILTLDDNNQKKGSVAVNKGKIEGIWNDSKPSSDQVNITSETEIIDLKGATAIPGFIDTHNHILSYSLNKNKVNCSSPPNKNIKEIMSKIKAKVDITPRGEWVEGYGYDDTGLEEQRHPTRKELDQVSPNHPVFLTHISTHLGVVNSKALELAGVKEDVKNPHGGQLGRDENGHLDGVLHEFPAMDFVKAKVPIPSTDQMVAALSLGSQDYLSKGITTNTDAGIGLFFGENEYEAHLIASETGLNPMRSQLMIMHELLRDDEKFSGYTAEQLNKEIVERSGGKAKLDSAKMFQDGSIQGLTAALRKPYYNNDEILGELLVDQKTFNEEISNLHKRGFRIAIHGNGDRAIGSILEAYDYALQKNPRIDHRHRIEHVQTASIDDLDKMKALGVVGSVFINHVYYWGDRHKRLFLGPERAARIDPLADMKKRRILTTLHSDCPVTPIDPLFSVWVAVNRLTSEGDILGENQKIDVINALKAMTIYGAIMNFTENENGSIEVGKQADFAILEKDPTTVDPLEIKDILIQATIIDGVVVYEKKKNMFN